MRICADGKVGIGTHPSKAKLEVSGMVGNIGNTVGLFGRNQGISLVANWPSIGFNEYFDEQWKSLSSGWTGHIYVDQNNGSFNIDVGREKVEADAIVMHEKRLTILKNGNVGIGTPKPEARLHVNNGDILLGNNQAVMFEDNGGSNHQILRLDANNDVTLWNPKGGPNDDIYFGTGLLGGPNIRMVVKGGGNVGIGTTMPQRNLHIKADKNNPVIIEYCRPHNETAFKLLDSLKPYSLIIGGPCETQLYFYWKENDNKKYMVKLNGTQMF